ncbi:hypothetical protein WDW37_00260 [Bdellovibrionota bacterium FG-1]
MWQGQNSSKSGGRRGRNRPIHISRIQGALTYEIPAESAGSDGSQPAANDPVSVRLLLNDISSKGVEVMAEHEIPASVKVSLILNDPAPIMIQGKVAYCQNLAAETKIISDRPHVFRVGLLFIYDSPADQEQIKQFCAQIAQITLTPSRAA